MMPVPVRSSPSIRTEGWAAGTSEWMCTTEARSRLTSSTDASMNQSHASTPRCERATADAASARRRALEAPRQETLALPLGVGRRLGIVRDGHAVAAPRVRLLDVLQHFLP